MDLSAPDRSRRPAILHVLLAPWIYLFAPARAAAVMVAASAAAFWTMYAVHAMLLGATVVFWCIWAQTARWSSAPMVFTATTGPSAAPAGSWPTVEYRPLGEVWAEWHAERGFGLAEVIFILVIAGLIAGTLFLGWLNLPRVHRAGSYWKSFRQATRIVAAAAGALCVRVFGLAALVAVLDRPVPTGRSIDDEAAMLIALVFTAMPLLLLRWIGLAVDAAPRLAIAVPPAPCCEGCGYDLSVLPGGDRCPECGLALAASLTPGNLRRRSLWAQRPGLGSWFETSVTVVVRPQAFYRGLRVGDGEKAADRFARWHLFTIGVCASLWLLACLSAGSHRGMDEEDYLAVAAAGLITPVLGWLVHRTVAAVACSVAVAWRTLPDGARLAHAIAYETAFVWVNCIFSGALFTTFLGYDMWMSDALGFGFMRVFGMPPEPFAVLGGNLGIGLLWLVRYRWIVGAIRWANH